MAFRESGGEDCDLRSDGEGGVGYDYYSEGISPVEVAYFLMHMAVPNIPYLYPLHVCPRLTGRCSELHP
jgi:hypothetical protein